MAVAAETRIEEGAVGVDEDGNHHRPVDLVHLAKYTMGNRDLEREVLTLFSRQSDIYVARLREARDALAWLEAAHTLKGSARGIGAWQVAEAAESAERCSSKVGRDSCREVADLVADRVAEANGFIKALLAGS